MILIEKIEIFFAGLSEMAAGIPTLVLVPLIMILAAIGTTVIVGLLMGLIRLIFGQKAIDFIMSLPQRLNNASNGLNNSQNGHPSHPHQL